MRLTSRHPAFAPQDSMLLTQKARPAESGSRLRKSRYCCRTKNVVSSIGLDVGATTSLSMIVKLAALGEPNPAPAPDTLFSARFTTSLLSLPGFAGQGKKGVKSLSSNIRMRTVLLVSPGLKVTF